jgi:hypothetical protein
LRDNAVTAKEAKQLRDKELCDKINNILRGWFSAIKNSTSLGKSSVYLVGHDLVEENTWFIKQAMHYLNELGYRTILDVDGFGVISLEIRW